MDQTKAADTDPHAALLDLADMIGPLAHEVLNVLNNIVLKAAILGREVPEGLRDQVAEFRTFGHRASELLAIMQRYRQGIHIARQPVDLNAAVQSAAVLCRQQGLGVVEKLAPDLPLVWGNPVDARRLVHLLVRLAHACLPQDAVTVGTEQRDSGICLRVSHAGPAIAAEQLAAFFEPFGPVRTGEHVLERAACLTIARRLGATLRAESSGASLVLAVQFEASGGS